MDAKLADVLLKIVKRDLARRLAVMSETLAQCGLLLRGRLIPFLIYREFGKEAHVRHAQSQSQLEKMQGTKEIEGLETFRAFWSNLMLNFYCLPKPAHLYTAFLV